MKPVTAGVDGCRAGWMAAIDDGTTIRSEIFTDLADLAREMVGGIIAIDMPMGLPERIMGSGRAAEQAARSLLGARQSSVFAIPARQAIYAVDPQPQGMVALKAGHQIASEVAKSLSDPPRGVAFQTFNIFPRIRALDRFLIAQPEWRSQVFETHPEVAFWRMNDRRPLRHPKKIKGQINLAGMEERQTLLGTMHLPLETISAPPPPGAGQDDWLDALACLVTARMISAGKGLPFPQQVPADAHGIPMAIWSWV